MSHQFPPIHPPYNKDKLFGSLGPAFSTHWKGEGFSHIMYIDLLPKVIKWDQLEAQTNPFSTTTIIIDLDD
jgi:hypothetical protein